MSQPNVSRTMSDMEQRLDQGLFERHSEGIVRTPAGGMLLPHARLLVFEGSKAQEALDDLRELSFGHLRIGTVAMPVSAIG